ncbi:MAG: putative phage-related terminase [Myxococcales bacterium]|nr:putative phage-related terminase [Myxococcales bacterium]
MTRKGWEVSAESGQAHEHALEASLCVESFADFVTRFWPTIDAHTYKPTTASEAIIATLQAVAEGRIRRLAIEVPPGTGKSTLLALYGAWRLARNASHRAIYASHAYTIAANGLSLRARRIVESEGFHAMFPAIELRDDENTASVWATTSNGKYVAVGVGGALTGHRANETVVDDPLNSIDAHSKATRDTCHAWFGESFSTRVDGDGPITVVGQRLGTDDLIGRLKASGAAWTCLTLPAEFDGRRRCTVLALDGSVVWTDPRTYDGELLAPAILSRGKLDELKLGIGSAAFQSQYNQYPSSDENSMAPARWWRFYRPQHASDGVRRPLGCNEDPAAELPATFDRVVIAADLTFGSVKGDFAVVQVWGAKGGGRYLLRQWRQRAGFEDQVAAIKRFAAEFPGAKIAVEKAANGAAVIETLSKSLPGVVPQIPIGSKAQRLASVVPTLESGACLLPESANFIAELVEEFQTFPGRHDDQVDCAVWALLALQGSSYSLPEVDADDEGLVAYGMRLMGF